jgi:DNA-binding transcriptional LysR family regulator
MDLRELTHLIAIVDNHYNLTQAAAKLHISQPGLSQSIKKLESDQEITIFTRASGRITGLTPIGETLINNARNLIQNHEELMADLHRDTHEMRGKVRIGIPPLILTVMFTRFLSDLIAHHPNIEFEIVEEGAFELRRQLILQEIDFAVLLVPSDLNPYVFKEDIIFEDQLSCFMSESNPLANQASIQWSDLKNVRLAIFSNTFMIHHQLKRKFASLNLTPNIALMSSLWDFLLESVRDSDIVTILPAPIRNHIPYEGIAERPFARPFTWQVVLAYPSKKSLTRVEGFTRDIILNYFKFFKIKENTTLKGL